MSTKKTTKTQKNESMQKPLIEGANILMKEFKTPDSFLEFLNESLFWVEHFNRATKANESAFFIKLMIENIIQPWIKNGSNAMHEIAKGLGEIYSGFGDEGYLEEVSILLRGFAISCKDSPYFDTKKYLLSFNILYEISFCLRAYGDKIREQRKLSEAA